MYVENAQIIKSYVDNDNNGVHIIEGEYQINRHSEIRRTFQIQIGIISDGCKWYQPDTSIYEIEEDIISELYKMINDARELLIDLPELFDEETEKEIIHLGVKTIGMIRPEKELFDNEKKL